MPPLVEEKVDVIPNKEILTKIAKTEEVLKYRNFMLDEGQIHGIC